MTFTCKVEGNPVPNKLRFKREGNVYKDYDSQNGVDSEIKTPSIYSISYTETITSLVLSDTSSYTCTGENIRNGVTKSGRDVKSIIVVDDVTVTMKIDKPFPNKGDTVKITCLAVGG